MEVECVGNTGKTMQKQKARNSNLEFYRIIVMLLIVAHHYVVNSGLITLMGESPLSGRSIFFFLFGAWGKTGINCFVLITGYFMCKSQITLYKFMKLLLEVLFYNILIYALFVILGYEKLSFELIFNLLPGRVLKDDFTSCFLVFYLCIPFLNVLVQNLTKKQHFQLLALTLFIYTFHATPPKTYVSMNYVSWFCTLYIVASYLRFYPTKFDKNVKFWVGGVFLCIILSVLSILIKLWTFVASDNPFAPYRYVADCNEFLALATAVTSFMYFKNINIRQSKLINTIAASTFGVLLIHAHSDAMRKWLWQDFLDNIGHYADDLYWVQPIVATIVIFIICVIIDYVRIRIVEKPLLKRVFNN